MVDNNNDLKLFDDEVIKLTSNVVSDDITKRVTEMFDYQFNGFVTEKIIVPSFPSEFDIGLIVGSSGSGKSTLLRECFLNKGYTEQEQEWDNKKAICSAFDSFDEASKKLGAVGLNSIPTWLKPYNVLSNGEKFRADLSMRLKNNSVIDEYTSVVNRDTAISCSASIEKYIRNNGLKNIVFCSCHDDIIPYLKPMWVYDTDKHEFYDGRYLQRPTIVIKFIPCGKKAWTIFKRHHYLSGELNDASLCYMGVYNNEPIAFASFLSLPSKDLKHAWREHRMVVLPDFQGMGIGNKMSEMFGQAFVEKGCQYFCKTSNPRMGEHRDKSILWRATSHNHKNREDYIRNVENNKTTKYDMSIDKMQSHAHRVCYCHEYIGDGKKYPYTYSTDEEKNLVDTLELFNYEEVI